MWSLCAIAVEANNLYCTYQIPYNALTKVMAGKKKFLFDNSLCKNTCVCETLCSGGNNAQMQKAIFSTKVQAKVSWLQYLYLLQ